MTCSFLLSPLRLSALALAACVSLGCALPAFAAPSLYYDQAHGEGPPPGQLKALADKIGLTLAAGVVPLSEQILAEQALLFLRAPSSGFSAQEKAAITGFVERGGSLFLILDEERRQPLEKTGVNDIITPFGLKLTLDTPYLHNQGAIAKAGVIHRQDREIPFSGGRAVEGGTPFAFQLDAAGQPGPACAAFVVRENGGKVVVMGEGMAAMFLGRREGERLSGVPNDPSKTTYWGKDSAIFMEEVLAWLAKRPTSGAEAGLSAGLNSLSQ